MYGCGDTVCVVSSYFHLCALTGSSVKTVLPVT
jgi:hypothetical protein